MNRYALICRSIFERPDSTQRELASALDVSLGTINTLMKECIEKRLIAPSLEHGTYQLLEEGQKLLEQYKVDGAVIIAAGFGSRFVPLTFETPKGLLEVFGERMIERQIKQLHEVDIYDITIVVGYLKEKFEYLIDKYEVSLLYNPEYSSKNTLATIYRAKHLLQGRNMYLLSSDNWLRDTMFHTYECGAWYSSVYQKGDTSEWCLRFNKRGLITGVEVGGQDSYVMYGPAFFSKAFSETFLPILESYYSLPGTEALYWEQVYLDILDGSAKKYIKNPTMKIPEMYINRQSETQVYEFENLEELRLFDQKYQNQSNNQAMELIAKVFSVKESQIHNIRCLKAGMTNKSFLFELQDKHYICRIPGPGTELLINRQEEKAVYDAVAPLGITEHIIYLNGSTGYKIADYYEGSHNADATNMEDMNRCMELVRTLHQAALHVEHSFNMEERIGFYERLCMNHGGIPFDDYDTVRGCMEELLQAIKLLQRPLVLSHVDSVADNFLFLKNGEVRLIDWEYAGMCDPLVDVSMCAIYSFYKEAQVEQLINMYLQRQPTEDERLVYYSYIALGGFLWTLWAIYKSSCGEEFGEYTLLMYRYAKQYYRKIKSENLKKL